MAKKIEMSREEQILYNQLQKLAKQANQRLLRIERLTGEKGTFASKQLYDYLGTTELNAITPSSRIKVSKAFNLNQLKAIKKATEQFLAQDVSKVSGVKKLTKQYSEQAEKPINYKQADVLYKSGKHYTWIYEYIPKSEFWDSVKVAKNNGWDKETFIDHLKSLNSQLMDEELQADLEALYIYVMG